MGFFKLKFSKDEDDVPDELPPLEGGIRINDSGSSNLAPDEIPIVDDEKDSYFSHLISRLGRKDMREDAEKEILSKRSGDLIGALNNQLSNEKHSRMLVDVEKEINEKTIPLKELECEWKRLKIEIEEKNKILREKEEHIKKNAEELKKLVHKRNNLHSKISGRKSGKKK